MEIGKGGGESKDVIGAYLWECSLGEDTVDQSRSGAVVW